VSRRRSSRSTNGSSATGCLVLIFVFVILPIGAVKSCFAPDAKPTSSTSTYGTYGSYGYSTFTSNPDRDADLRSFSEI
jgi:hypothetical protein